jgi:oligoribonuclease NrnB/cAMP/cGMP phosphodiesterase (DHH superfamily)
MKIKIFTHDDIDAAGCGILGTLAYGNDVNIEYHHHESLAKRWPEFLIQRMAYTGDVYTDYDLIFICDICPTEEWAKVMDDLNKKQPRFKVFDHHKSALHLTQYDWATIKIEHYPGHPACGTSLFYNYLVIQGLVPQMEDEFINLIRELDTWEWEKKNNLRARDLGRLFTFYGMEAFVESYVHHFTKNDTGVDYFNEFDNNVLYFLDKEIESYLKSKSKNIIEKEVDGYNAAIVFAEKFPSELGNYIAKNNPQYDLAIIINASNGISYRCVKDNVDLSEIAKRRGGGGHQKASGSPVSDEAKLALINSLF